MSQKLPVNRFKWVEKKEKLSKFNENFIKEYNEISEKGYFLEADVEYPKTLLILIKIYHFCLKDKKLKK